MLKKLTLVLLVAVLAGMSVYLVTRERVYSTTSSKSLDFYQRGVESLMKFYYEEGRNFMELAVQEDPDFALPYLFLLRMDFGDQTKDQRTAWYKRLANPTENWTTFECRLIELATQKVDRDNPEEMKQKLEQFLREYSSQMEAFYLLLPMYQQLEEDPEKLVAYYEKLHQLFPNNVQILNQLGYFYVGLGEERKAEATFEKYEFIRPDEANPYDSFGEMLYNTGRFQEAEAKFKMALEKKSDFVLSALNLTQALMRQGKIDEAQQVLNQLEEQNSQMKRVPDMLQYFRFLSYVFSGDRSAVDQFLSDLPEMDIMDSLKIQIRMLDCFNRADVGCVDEILTKLESKGRYGYKTDTHVHRARYENALGNYEKSNEILRKVSCTTLNADFDIRLYVYYILIDNNIHLGNRSEAETLAADLPDGYREFLLMRIAAGFDDAAAARRLSGKVLAHFASADPDFYVIVEAKRYAESGHHDPNTQASQALRWFDGPADGPNRGHAGAGKG